MIHALRADGTTTDNPDKQKRDAADYFLKRWAMLVGLGLPPLGYPKQSPEQERVRGVDTREIEISADDEAVIELVNKLDAYPKRIVKAYFMQQLPMRKIAMMEGLSPSGVKWRLDHVRWKVAQRLGL